MWRANSIKQLMCHYNIIWDFSCRTRWCQVLVPTCMRSLICLKLWYESRTPALRWIKFSHSNLQCMPKVFHRFCLIIITKRARGGLASLHTHCGLPEYWPLFSSRSVTPRDIFLSKISFFKFTHRSIRVRRQITSWLTSWMGWIWCLFSSPSTTVIISTCFWGELW